MCELCSNDPKAVEREKERLRRLAYDLRTAANYLEALARNGEQHNPEWRGWSVLMAASIGLNEYGPTHLQSDVAEARTATRAELRRRVEQSVRRIGHEVELCQRLIENDAGLADRTRHTMGDA